MVTPLTDAVITELDPPDPATLAIVGDPTPEVDDEFEPDSLGDAEDQS